MIFCLQIVVQILAGGMAQKLPDKKDLENIDVDDYEIQELRDYGLKIVNDIDSDLKQILDMMEIPGFYDNKKRVCNILKQMASLSSHVKAVKDKCSVVMYDE